MKVAVRDSTALRALKPLEMAAYLQGMGWRKKADFDGKASLWLREAQDSEELDVILPLKQELGDYALRMGQTEQGSYVLTMLSPVPPELKAAQEQVELPGIIEPVEPYERRVIRTLVTALGALDEAARVAAMSGDMGSVHCGSARRRIREPL